MELEQIAKQGSLLNRLLELLRMQEEPEKAIKKFGWYKVKADGFWVSPVLTWDEVATIAEAWNHSVTQKAWSDELVQVARDLKSIAFSHHIRVMLAAICYSIHVDSFPMEKYAEEAIPKMIEAILNKYSRSLSE